MIRLLARLSVLGLMLGLLAGLGMLLRPSEFAWWGLNLAGVAGLLMILASSVLRPAAGAAAPARRYLLHLRLARAGLVLAGVHVLGILAIDRSIWLYAAPFVSLDLFMGVLALVAILAVALVREPAMLRRWPSLMSLPHRLPAVLALVLTVAHVALVPSMSPWSVAGIVIASGIVLAALYVPVLVQGRWQVRPRTLVVSALAAGALVAGAGPLVEARMAALKGAPATLRMFDHASHTTVGCTTCHHNFVDRSGFENCVPCHQTASTDEWNRIDRTFHAFCTGCHAERRMSGGPSGPIQSCDGCHAKAPGSTSTRNSAIVPP